MANSEKCIRNRVQDMPDSEVTALLMSLHALGMVLFAPEIVCSSSAFYSEATVDDLCDYNREASIKEIIRLHTFGITKGIYLIETLANMDKDTESQIHPYIAFFDALRQQRLNHLETVGEIQFDALMERKYARNQIDRLRRQVLALENANDHLGHLLAIRRDDDDARRDDDDVHIIPALDS
eukprot:scaffold2632_cov124-Skeletonema_menzelii.AAC.9